MVMRNEVYAAITSFFIIDSPDYDEIKLRHNVAKYGQKKTKKRKTNYIKKKSIAPAKRGSILKPSDLIFAVLISLVDFADRF